MYTTFDVQLIQFNYDLEMQKNIYVILKTWDIS